MHRNRKRYTRGQTAAMPKGADAKGKAAGQANQSLSTALHNLSGFPPAINQQ